jgi:hypothetical protein
MGIENLMMDQGLRMRELSDYGGTFTYPASGGNDYPCSLGQDNEGTKMAPTGGFTFAGDQTVIIRKSCISPSIDFSLNPPGLFCILTDKTGVSRNLKIAPEGVKDLRYAWQLILQNVNNGA